MNHGIEVDELSGLARLQKVETLPPAGGGGRALRLSMMMSYSLQPRCEAPGPHPEPGNQPARPQAVGGFVERHDEEMECLLPVEMGLPVAEQIRRVDTLHRLNLADGPVEMKVRLMEKTALAPVKK